MPPRAGKGRLAILPSLVPPSPALGAMPMPVMETVETVLASVEIPREGKIEKFNATEVKRLASLTYPNGTPVLSLTKRSAIYEVVGAMLLQGVELIINAIEFALNEAKTAYEDRRVIAAQIGQPFDERIQSLDLVFDMPTFTAQKNQYLADTDRQRRAISVMVGVIACSRCRSKNTATVQIQTRSADEAIMTMTSCFACGKVDKQG